MISFKDSPMHIEGGKGRILVEVQAKEVSRKS